MISAPLFEPQGTFDVSRKQTVEHDELLDERVLEMSLQLEKILVNSFGEIFELGVFSIG